LKKYFIFLIVILLLSYHYVSAGITGKIVGRILDAETDEPLIGVNVVVEGTLLGAATDMDGYFVILNLPPGTYTLKASMVGYTNVKTKNVVVVIDLTTTIDFKMSIEVLDMDEIVIVAERPIVTKDVSASLMNVGSKTIESLPVQSVEQVVGVQAGIQGLEVRGSSSHQTAFMLDGLSLNDERSNYPYTDISLSSIQEVQIQTGGFNAEYGNVRSGLINVVTKEGSRQRYSGTITYRHQPAAAKHFGSSIYSVNSYFARPYTDPDVCWTGTDNGAWDEYMQRQYPYFEGWNAVSEATMKNADPNDDLTPDGAKRLWEWQHRRQGDIEKPDFNLDLGFGGPVPVFGGMLGDLRFFASYRQEREMFLFPLSRDSYEDNSTQLKFVSDITPSMKLTLTGMYGEIYSVSPYDWKTTPTGYVLRSTEELANLIGSNSGNSILYMPGYYSPTTIYRNMIGAKFTHVLSPRTFYEVSLQFNRNKYNSYQMADRDTSRIYEPVPGYYVDEAPYGYDGYGDTAIGDNMRIGGWMNLGRDKSINSTTSFRFDLTSQVNFRNQIKAGLQVVYNDYKIRSSTENPGMSTWNRELVYDRFPYRVGAYIQDKLEFKGFIANLGLRLDYSDANGTYYDLEPYDQYFQEAYGDLIEDEAPIEETELHLYLSPRLGISHPITDNSKLYFNYGHFYQEPASSYRFRLQRESNGFVTHFGNPNLDLEKTVAYELGYAQNVLNLFLLNVAAYYKDITNQPNWIYYQNIVGSVSYSRAENNNYEDIRGLELTLTKSYGNWITGFINYTYEVGTSGYFGLTEYWEDPNKQREYLLDNPYQEKPHPRPYARANIDLHTPEKFGPQWFGWYPLEMWYVNILTEWQAGRFETYNPNNIPGVVDDVQWRDYYNADLRISKNIRFSKIEMQLYLDIANVFNIKYMAAGLFDYKNYSGFSNVYDYLDYLESLHFSWEERAEHGDDQLGDYRKPGVDFQPIESVPDVSAYLYPSSDVIYYDTNTDRYMEYKDNNWYEVSQNRIDKILDNKAYIDMPNLSSLAFVNPRSYRLGIKISF